MPLPETGPATVSVRPAGTFSCATAPLATTRPRVAGSVYVVFVNANATCALFDRTRPSASNASGTPSPPLRFTYGSAPVLLTTIGPLNPVRVPADMSNTPWPPPPLHTSVPVPVRVAPRVSERLSDGAYEIVNRPPAPIWQLPIRVFSQFPMPSSKPPVSSSGTTMFESVTLPPAGFILNMMRPPSNRISSSRVINSQFSGVRRTWRMT